MKVTQWHLSLLLAYQSFLPVLTRISGTPQENATPLMKFVRYSVLFKTRFDMATSCQNRTQMP